MRRLALPVAALTILALSVIAAVVHLQARKELSQLRAEFEAHRENLTVITQQRNTAGTRLAEALDQLASLAATLREDRAFAAEMALMRSRICRVPVTEEVRMEVLQPRDGQTVKSPVLVHLFVTDPLGCDATYHVRVDDVPYLPLGQSAGQPPFTRTNPEKTRPVRKNAWEGACVSSVYQYLSIELPPGAHSLSVGGCPQGTAVPRTLPVSVRFKVSKPGRSAGSSAVAERRVIYHSGGVTLIEDPSNVCPVDSFVPSSRDIELLEGAVVRAVEEGLLGATEPPLDTSGTRASALVVTEDPTFRGFARRECDASVWDRQVGIEVTLATAVSASLSQQRYLAAKVREGWILWFPFHP